MNWKKMSLLLITAAVALAVVPQVIAHDWSCWVQPNRTVSVRNTASYFSEANAALNEWDNDTILSIPRTSSHTEVSLYDGNYGNTGWGGLAEIISYSGCNITHCHARLNYYYSYTSNGKRGVFCQEFGHCLGLQHSNDGGCMGGGYYYSIDSNYTVVSHNISDINTKYQYKHADGHGEETDGPRRVVEPLWYDHPTTLVEARDLASAIVLVEVASIEPSTEIVIPIKGTEGEEDRIPTETVGLTVRNVLHGEAPDFIQLFHTGNEDFVLSGDPQYEIGEKYVLFITPRGDGTYRTISPEGRFQVTANGFVSMSEESFAQEMQGLRVRDLARDLNERAAMDLAK